METCPDCTDLLARDCDACWNRYMEEEDRVNETIWGAVERAFDRTPLNQEDPVEADLPTPTAAAYNAVSPRMMVTPPMSVRDPATFPEFPF